MVSFGNKKMRDEKNIFIELSSIYGIGRSTSLKILNSINISPNKKVKDLKEEEILEISQKIKRIKTGAELKIEYNKNIESQISIGTYKGIRRSGNNPLPVNGQRTRHNAQTVKKLKSKKKNANSGYSRKKTPLKNKK